MIPSCSSILTSASHSPMIEDPCAMRYSSNRQTSFTGFGPRGISSVRFDFVARFFRSAMVTSRIGVGKAVSSGSGREMMEGRKVAWREMN